MVAYATMCGLSNVADQTKCFRPTLPALHSASSEDLVSSTARWARMATSGHKGRLLVFQ